MPFIKEKFLDVLMVICIFALMGLVTFGMITIIQDIKPNDSDSNRQKMTRYIAQANHKYDYTQHIKKIEYNSRTDNLTVITNQSLPTTTVMTYNPATKTMLPMTQTDTDSKLYRNSLAVGKKIIKNSPAKGAKAHVD